MDLLHNFDSGPVTLLIPSLPLYIGHEYKKQKVFTQTGGLIHLL